MGVLAGDYLCEEMVVDSSPVPSLPSLPPPEDEFPLHVLPLRSGLDLQAALAEALVLEPKYQAALSISMLSRNVQEINGRMRNGSCHVLRCLKVWYELPSDTFFTAVNNMDRFLTKMKAQPKHLSCIAVASFHVACEDSSIASGQPVPSRESVSAISQSKCTAGDVQRMGDIIRNKLNLTGAHGSLGTAAPVDASPITPLTFLRLMHKGIGQLVCGGNLGNGTALPPLLRLVHKLEMVVCDTRAVNFRPCELSIALLKREVPSDNEQGRIIQSCLLNLTTQCQIRSTSLRECENVVEVVLCEYEGALRGKQALHKQHLVWKLSNRTKRLLRPISRAPHHRMAPIQEGQEAADRPISSESPSSHSLSPAELKLRARRGLMFFYGDIEEEIEPMEIDEVIPEVENKTEEEIPKIFECEEINCEVDMEIEDGTDFKDVTATSYSQIAKKYKKDMCKVRHDFTPPMTNFGTRSQTSPFSKIRVLPAPARNLSELIESASSDPSSTPPPSALPFKISDYSVLPRRNNGKRKKAQMRMNARPRLENQDETISPFVPLSPPSSSEEDIGSDYEKAFPPLPRHSPPLLRRKKKRMICHRNNKVL